VNSDCDLQVLIGVVWLHAIVSDENIDFIIKAEVRQ
jgi:hypothetical protein